jgi:hypothetical protein
MGRKGFELAISTLVVMILGIVILGGGIMLLAKLVDSAQPIAEDLSTEQLRDLRRLLANGQLVATTPADQGVDAGKYASVGVMVENRLASDATFTVDVVGKDNDDKPIPLATSTKENGKWLISYFTELPVDADAQGTAIINIRPGKDVPRGTYIFIVTIEEAGKQYDLPRSFTLRVR